jgi:hypothetical protein
MKKVFLLFSACALTATSFAQEPAKEVMKSKRGYVILPQAGDIALGFDAIPVLDFALNAADIMNAGESAEHPGFVSGFNNIIVGKYFLKDNMAIRGRFGINTLKTTTKNYGLDPLAPAGQVPENILISTNKLSEENTYFLAGGIEKRRGHNRLQGFYGGEVLLGFNSGSEKNTYEIEFNQAAFDAGYMAEFGNSRVLSAKDGIAVTFGIRGFIGVEYFVAPKISIGAEFGWGLGIITTPRGKVETENWGIEPGSSATTASAYTEETEGPESSRDFKFSVDDGASDVLGTSGALSINFHF